MHVLTLTPFYPNVTDDAAGCFIAEPLTAFDPLDIECSVIAVQPWYRRFPGASPTTPRAVWVRYPAVPSGMGLSTAGTFLFARLLSPVRELHRMHPIDLVHAHGALPCGHAASLLSTELRIPFVVTVHGLDVFSTRQVNGFPGKWCQRVSRMVYRSAARTICISEKVRDQVLAGASVPTEVVYNGVDPKAFFPPPTDMEGPVLAVGNLIPIKGHELLLRAIAALPTSRISCQIIGDGPERSRLVDLATELKIASRVQFLGHRSRRQVAEAMHKCVLFALPSRYEGLGCVYLEAMSSGKAVICCQGQGIEEVVQHGVNGWLVEPDSLSGLTEALSLLLKDSQLRRRIGESARAAILRSFTFAHQAMALGRIYRDCVRAPSR
jgi:teichuronic acid biosynthesis glycosyltransferase TuaC